MRSQVPGAYGFGRTGDWTRSQKADQLWRWRQGSVSGASPERASLERASGVAGQEIQEPSLIRLRKIKLRMSRTWSNLL